MLVFFYSLATCCQACSGGDTLWRQTQVDCRQSAGGLLPEHWRQASRDNLVLSQRLHVTEMLVLYSVTVTILASENCQSISFQKLLSASQLFRLCDLTLSTETVKQLQSFCHSCHYGQTKHRVTKLRSSQRTFLPVSYHHSLS